MAVADDPASDTPLAAVPAEATDEPPKWEGAIGVNLSYAPAYAGAADTVLKARPGFFLRYGRFTVTNSSGFVTRRSDDVVRGLGIDLLQGADLRLNLALRFDQGRSDGDSPDLQGLGDVSMTVRARLSGTWRFAPAWRAGASVSVDAFGRGGGHLGDVSVAREFRGDDGSLLTVGSGLSFAGDRYTQSYFGVNDAQSAATGYPVYTPGGGLRDATVFANWRRDLGPRWIWLAQAGVNHLLGPAADSPLTRRTTTWSLGTGLAWRF